MEDNIILKVKDLKKKYENADKYVLNGVDLVLYDGDFLCILGPSGCGKSTLIRCIAGFEEYEGIIESKGKKITTPGPDRVTVFQDFSQLFPWMTVIENVIYPLKINGIKDKTARKEQAMKYLKIVKLNGYEDYYPHQLSGGMKQRVAIARGMVLHPDILLMDEPFAALDAITRDEMQSELLRIKEETGMSIIFITHNIQEAMTLGNRIVVMTKAGNISENIVNELERPVTPATEGFGTLWEHLHSIIL